MSTVEELWSVTFAWPSTHDEAAPMTSGYTDTPQVKMLLDCQSGADGVPTPPGAPAADLQSLRLMPPPPRPPDPPQPMDTEQPPKVQ